MEKGILMSGVSVKAGLAGLKHCTRRTQGLEVINREPEAWCIGGGDEHRALREENERL